MGLAVMIAFQNPNRVNPADVGYLFSGIAAELCSCLAVAVFHQYFNRLDVVRLWSVILTGNRTHVIAFLVVAAHIASDATFCFFRRPTF